MRLLVCGPESSGTKMVASLLKQAGADVTHNSPNYRREEDSFPHTGENFDAVVIVVRNWLPNVESMIDAGHADSFSQGREMVINGLSDIIYGLKYSDLYKRGKVYLVTYESIVHEPSSINFLCDELLLDFWKITDTIGNGNAKYYGGDYFRDQRELHER